MADTTDVVEKEKVVYHLSDMEGEIQTFNTCLAAYKQKFTRNNALELRKSLLRMGKICDAGRKEVQDAVKAKYGDSTKDTEKTEAVVEKSVKKEKEVLTQKPASTVTDKKPPAKKKPVPEKVVEKVVEPVVAAKKAPPKKKTT